MNKTDLHAHLSEAATEAAEPTGISARLLQSAEIDMVAGGGTYSSSGGGSHAQTGANSFRQTGGNYSQTRAGGSFAQSSGIGSGLTDMEELAPE